jgi:putative membrane protein
MEDISMITNRTYSRILMLTVTALMAGATAIAQMQPGGPPTQQPTPGQANPQQPGQTTNPADGMTSNAGASFSDQSFVRSIFESDAAEVQLGQMAQQKSPSPDVKALGQRMVLNRTKLDEQLKPIADKLSVEKPKEPSKKDRQEIAKLEELSGPQFDEEYLKAVAKDNQKNVKDFQSEAQTAQDPALQQAAKQDAGILAQHQQAVEQIAQTHNVALDEKK